MSKYSYQNGGCFTIFSIIGIILVSIVTAFEGQYIPLVIIICLSFIVWIYINQNKYRQNKKTQEKNINKETNHNTSTVFIALICIFLAVVVVVIINTNNNHNYIERNINTNSKSKKAPALSNNLPLSDVEYNNTQTVIYQPNQIYEPIKVKKYVLVVFEIKEPSLFYQEPIRSIVEGIKDYEEFYMVSWKTNISVSNIFEYENFTNDDGYILMDESERFVKIVPESFSNDVINKISDYSDRTELLNNHTRITKRYFLTFDTYSEASIKRENLLIERNNK